MAHTRLVAGCTETGVALNRFRAAVIKEPESFAAHYGYGLVLGKTGEYDRAISQLKSALGKRALDSYILTDLGKIYYRSGNYEKASCLLADCIDTEINDPEVNLILGCAQLKAGQLKAAAATLENLVGKKIDSLHSKQEKRERKPAETGSGSDRGKGRGRPEPSAGGDRSAGNSACTQALYHLGEVYHKLDQPGAAYYYLGLYFLDKKDDETAKHHLTVALRQTEDPERRQLIEKLLERIDKASDSPRKFAGGRSGGRGRNLTHIQR